MKKLRISNTVAAYNLSFLYYGKIIPKGLYKLEAVIPYTAGDFITLYKSKKKPLFRNLYLLLILLLPLYILTHILMLLFFAFKFLTSFYNTCLFERSFISANYEKVSGVISLVFSVIGFFWCIYKLLE